jgi:glycosyltransferase involved in cell wall biosynthesis
MCPEYGNSSSASIMRTENHGGTGSSSLFSSRPQQYMANEPAERVAEADQPAARRRGEETKIMADRPGQDAPSVEPSGGATSVEMKNLSELLRQKDDQIRSLEVTARRVGDLSILRASQDARLGRLGSALADALRMADSSERALVGAKAELEDLRAAVATKDREVTLLRDQLAAREAQIALMQSSRAWRLRSQVLRARVWAEARLRSRLPKPPMPTVSEPTPAELRGVEAEGGTGAATPLGGREIGRRVVAASEPGGHRSRSVVFISHDAHPYGAEIFLLRLLRWFREYSDLQFEVILGGGGPLQPEFEKIARVSSLQPDTPDRLSEEDPLMRRLRSANVRLIYSNTITNGRLLGALSALECPVLTHVHELGFWIRNRVRAVDLRIVRDHTTRFIGASEAVRRALIEDVGVTSENVVVIHECVPIRSEAHVRRVGPEQIREELGIPEEAWIVGACGSMDWRKGPDLFVQLGREVSRRVSGRPVHFLWVGGSNDGPERASIWHDVVMAGLADSMHLVGHRDNPRDYLAAYDVFALTSREDPFPIVVLEAATVGVPTVCFDASGGAKEFVEDDCGFVVPYLDLGAMAEHVAEILMNPALRGRLSSRAKEKVAQRHDIDVVAPLLLREIDLALRHSDADGN